MTFKLRSPLPPLFCNKDPNTIGLWPQFGVYDPNHRSNALIPAGLFSLQHGKQSQMLPANLKDVGTTLSFPKDPTNCKDKRNHLVVFCLHPFNCIVLLWYIWWRTTQLSQSMETFAYYMDITQIHELNFRTRIVFNAFTTSAAGTICNGGCVAAGINNENFLKANNINGIY